MSQSSTSPDNFREKVRNYFVYLIGSKKEAEMKSNNLQYIYFFSSNKLRALSISLVLLLTLMIPAAVLASKDIIVEGVIQGANCVHNKTSCPEDRIDAHIALEHDFLLVSPDGEHYFLPNLNRAIKARYVTKSVRIQGKKEGHGIWVDRLDVKKNSKYQNVWSWEEQQEMYKGGGG